MHVGFSFFRFNSYFNWMPWCLFFKKKEKEIMVSKKNSAGWGKTAPTVLSYREELSTPGRENPRTPASPKACTVTWAGDHCHSPQAGPHRYHRPGHPRRETQRGDFFNLNLKFAPTGSRTQDLRSAAGFL